MQYDVDVLYFPFLFEICISHAIVYRHLYGLARGPANTTLSAPFLFVQYGDAKPVIVYREKKAFKVRPQILRFSFIFRNS